MSVSDEIDPERLKNMRKKIIEFERENMGTRKFGEREKKEQVARIIQEEVERRY
jgi:uncharacterized membrane protein (DUF106 family)